MSVTSLTTLWCLVHSDFHVCFSCLHSLPASLRDLSVKLTSLCFVFPIVETFVFYSLVTAFIDYSGICVHACVGVCVWVCVCVTRSRGTQTWTCVGTLWFVENQTSVNQSGANLKILSLSSTPAAQPANQR